MSQLNLHLPIRLSINCTNGLHASLCTASEHSLRPHFKTLKDTLEVCCQCECHYTREAFSGE